MFGEDQLWKVLEACYCVSLMFILDAGVFVDEKPYTFLYAEGSSVILME